MRDVSIRRVVLLLLCALVFAYGVQLYFVTVGYKLFAMRVYDNRKEHAVDIIVYRGRIGRNERPRVEYIPFVGAIWFLGPDCKVDAIGARGRRSLSWLDDISAFEWSNVTLERNERGWYIRYDNECADADVPDEFVIRVPAVEAH